MNKNTKLLPLAQDWERVAAKDLADLMHLLTHGLFINPEDFAERLRQSADQLSEEFIQPDTNTDEDDEEPQQIQAEPAKPLATPATPAIAERSTNTYDDWSAVVGEF
jgi:hypothetical protein